MQLSWELSSSGLGAAQHGGIWRPSGGGDGAGAAPSLLTSGLLLASACESAF